MTPERDINPMAVQRLAAWPVLPVRARADQVPCDNGHGDAALAQAGAAGAAGRVVPRQCRGAAGRAGILRESWHRRLPHQQPDSACEDSSHGRL